MAEKIESKLESPNDDIVDDFSQLDISNKPTMEEYFAFLPNDYGDTMLHSAILEKDEHIVMYLINMAPSRAWINLKNSLSQTPLHLAVLTNQLTVARRLVVGGARLTSQDDNGNTPLHLASMKGFTMIARALTTPVTHIERKENRYDIPHQSISEMMNIYNFEGMACTHVAALHRNNQIMKIFIQRGANMDLKERKHGKTCLHIACVNGDDNMINLLCRTKSCDTTAETYDGYTPGDFLDKNRRRFYKI